MKCKKGYKEVDGICRNKRFLKNSNMPPIYNFGGVHIGTGFLGLLTLLFWGLKLAKIIDWSWLWVLSPLWIPGAVALILFFGFLLIMKVFK